MTRDGNGVTIFQPLPNTYNVPDFTQPALNFSRGNGTQWLPPRIVPMPSPMGFDFDDE